MCLSCGCGQPNEQHGDPRHITLSQIEQAAQASNISVQQAIENIRQGAQSGGGQQQTQR